MCEYLPLLGIDYDTSISKTILQLRRIDIAEAQPLVSEITALVKLVCNECAMSARLKLWQRLGENGWVRERN